LATDIEDAREKKLEKVIHILRKKVSSDAAMNDFQAIGAAFNPSVRTSSS
jgi:hypothetical protein